MNLVTNRHIYYNKDWKQVVCQPLADWSAKDIFAYLFSNEVPILDVYFKTKFIGSPEKIRKSWILPSHQTSQGQAVWLKYYYPEIFRLLCMVNPKLRSFV
jgi:3'-phosphoadenosine 5'-phosphosulfate sulfotransferase (PAPS reductase)/FAD synthetase